MSSSYCIKNQEVKFLQNESDLAILIMIVKWFIYLIYLNHWCWLQGELNRGSSMFWRVCHSLDKHSKRYNPPIEPYRKFSSLWMWKHSLTQVLLFRLQPKPLKWMFADKKELEPEIPSLMHICWWKCREKDIFEILSLG